MLNEKVKAEMHQSVIEVGTGICRNIQRGARRRRQPAPPDDSSSRASTACCWRPARRIRSPTGACRTSIRTSATCRSSRTCRLVARSNLIFGLHVHVGIEDRETGIHLMNQMRYFLPHLLALSTNSPFWLGMNTGLKSYRCKVFDKFPRTNIPDTFTSWADFEGFVNLLIRTNCIDNAKRIWWDIRPHPFFSTLEVRICDIPMRVDETLAIAALIQATVAKLYKLHSRNQGFRIYSRALIMENKWRASRYGLDGMLIDFGREKELPARELILEYLEFVDDVLDELGQPEGGRVRADDPRSRHRRRSAAAGLRADQRSARRSSSTWCETKTGRDVAL